MTCITIKLTPQSTKASWQADKTSAHEETMLFKEPINLLQWSQEPTTGHYSEQMKTGHSLSPCFSR
jgi:hypothetical protein